MSPGPLILAALFALVGCGRGRFDAVPDATGARQPDLTLLLPDETADLIGYWRMDDNGADSGPRGNDLTALVGTPEFSQNAIIGGAAELYDTSFELTTRADVDVPYLSFAAWFRSDLIPTATSNSGQTLFRISCATCGGDPEIDIAGRVAIQNDGQLDTLTGDVGVGTIDANRWHHVVGIYAPNLMTIYLDGEPAGSVAGANAPLQTTGGILWVGQLWPNRAPLFNPQNLHGALDEVALWSSALTDAEARSIYPNQRP